MKTVFIFDYCGEENIKFYVLDGDFSHLNGIYINHYKHDQKLIEELYDLFFDETGAYKVPTAEVEFPVEAVKAGAKVIVVGYLP